ncbi:hypothetical protein M2387_001798 [Klebsiella sp. BIGb0407]|nr:hypothetical protein [Klebsiella sp. BIGb0407]
MLHFAHSIIARNKNPSGQILHITLGAITISLTHKKLSFAVDYSTFPHHFQ